MVCLKLGRELDGEQDEGGGWGVGGMKEKEDEHKQNAGLINGKHQVKAINPCMTENTCWESRVGKSREEQEINRSINHEAIKISKSEKKTQAFKSIGSSKLMLAGSRCQLLKPGMARY